jgi:hypothetical protein
MISSLPANQPVKLGNMTVSQAQLWISYAVISTIMLFLTAFTSMILYVVGVLFCLFAMHGGCMEKPVESEFEAMV